MDTPSKNGSYLVIAACLLAVISLVLGIISLKSLSAMKDELGGAGKFSARLDSIETSSRKASSDAEKAASRLATISADTQRAFDNVSKELATLRTSVNRVTIEAKQASDKVAGLGGRSTSPARPSSAAPTATPSSASPAPASTSGSAAQPPVAPTSALNPDGSYTIKAGDTFARLSGRFGVSVQDIEVANPGVDPRRLRIGQKVVIPSVN